MSGIGQSHIGDRVLLENEIINREVRLIPRDVRGRSRLRLIQLHGRPSRVSLASESFTCTQRESAIDLLPIGSRHRVRAIEGEILREVLGRALELLRHGERGEISRVGVFNGGIDSLIRHDGDRITAFSCQRCPIDLRRVGVFLHDTLIALEHIFRGRGFTGLHIERASDVWLALESTRVVERESFVCGDSIRIIHVLRNRELANLRLGGGVGDLNGPVFPTLNCHDSALLIRRNHNLI